LGGGYSTGFVLFNDSPSFSSGNISGVLRNGLPMNIRSMCGAGS
jgi:hypothetical protein